LAILTGFSWFSSVPPGKCQDSTSVRTQSLPVKSCPIHQSSCHSTLYSPDTESDIKINPQNNLFGRCSIDPLITGLVMGPVQYFVKVLHAAYQARIRSNMLSFLQIKQLSRHACDNKITEGGIRHHVLIICLKVGTYCLPLQSEYKRLSTFWRIPLPPSSDYTKTQKSNDISENYHIQGKRMKNVEKY
jgi:hypothetical protein